MYIYIYIYIYMYIYDTVSIYPCVPVYTYTVYKV